MSSQGFDYSSSLRQARTRTAEELSETLRRKSEPLRELMRTVRSSGADLIVVGARGTSGIRHLLLGSIAEGILSRSPVPVLLAR